MIKLDKEIVLNKTNIEQFVEEMGLKCVLIESVSRGSLEAFVGATNYYKVRIYSNNAYKTYGIDELYVYVLDKEGKIVEEDKVLSKIWRAFNYKRLQGLDETFATDPGIADDERDSRFAEQYKAKFEKSKSNAIRALEDRIKTVNNIDF